MMYLLAKYALLFVLTALLGFVLGYWFSRRNIVDVSESFEDLRKANDRSDSVNWDRLWKHLDAIPAPKETDLSGVFERIDSVSNVVSSLPKPERVSFAAVESRLDGLANDIKSIPVAKMPAPVNLQPVQNEMGSLRNAIKDLPKVETHAPVDLAPLTSKLGLLEQRIDSIPRPERVDLAPIDRRLTAIESELGNLGRRIAQPKEVATAPREAPPKATRKEPRILKAALYGKQDDLKLIYGVGPKLEKLLNHNGVYYFWQVASWSRQDVDIIDDRLDVFKGRITRDDWVRQAKQLKAEPTAAPMPND